MPIYKARGWLRDEFDARDRPFIAKLPEIALPPAISLRADCPPIYDQGTLGSCVGNGVAGCFHYLRMKQGKKDAERTPSRLLIYYNARELEDTVMEDSGAYIRDGVKTVAKLGVCFEDDPDAWKYDPIRFADRPPPACYAVGLENQVLDYRRVDQRLLRAIKAALAEKLPVVFGMWVYGTFETKEVADSGFVPMPGPKDEIIGGHCMVIIGYDDTSRLFEVRNSWGADWGDGGHCFIPYEYLTDPKLSDDFWVLRIVE